jgi:MerR family transcriptional regulator, thiopeptide resistance regulator
VICIDHHGIREYIMTNANQGQYRDEARERWGSTDAYKQSSKRTKGYGDADWKRINKEQSATEAAFAEALAAGEPADGARATDLAEEARLHIDGSFYPCSHAMHSGLAEMYTADERFRAHYEDRAEGLAAYVAEAIKANALRRLG